MIQFVILEDFIKLHHRANLMLKILIGINFMKISTKSSRTRLFMKIFYKTLTEILDQYAALIKITIKEPWSYNTKLIKSLILKTLVLY